VITLNKFICQIQSIYLNIGKTPNLARHKF